MDLKIQLQYHIKIPSFLSLYINVRRLVGVGFMNLARGSKNYITDYGIYKLSHHLLYIMLKKSLTLITSDRDFILSTRKHSSMNTTFCELL